MADPPIDAPRADVPSSAVERANPVVLVIRHPDASDQIELFGLPENVRIEYLDLGSSFDIGHRDRLGRLDAAEWVEWHLQSLSELPDGHRAKVSIQNIIATVCERFGLNEDGTFVDDDPVWGKAEDAFTWS